MDNRHACIPKGQRKFGRQGRRGNHYTVDRGWAEEVPYITAVVQLKEGPRVVGHLRGVEPGGAELGQTVQVTVEPRGEDFAFLAVELV